MIYLSRKWVVLMNDIMTVIKFSIKDLIKRKSFIVSTIILVLTIIIGFNIPNIIKMFNNDVDEKIIISDKDNIYEGMLTELNSIGYDVTITDDSVDELKEKIKNDEITSGIVIEKVNNTINLTYVVENELFMDSNMELSDILSSLYQAKEVDKLNLTEDEINNIYPNFNFEISSIDEISGNIILAFVVSMLLFIAIYFFAYQVSGSITLEKTSKIVETLVTSTSPKNIILGKTIGIGIIGILQTILLIITGIISAKLFIDPNTLNSLFDLSKINVTFIILIIVEFILGYFIYAFIYALIGSTVSKPEEVQSANTPVNILLVLSIYLLIFTMQNPHGSINYLSSLIPISSPFSMPFRYVSGFASTTDIIISLLILILTIVLIAYLTIKIYSNAILNYGTKFNLKNIIKIYKQK